MKNYMMKVKAKVANIKDCYDKKVKVAKIECVRKKEIAKRNLVDSICNGWGFYYEVTTCTCYR